MMIHRYPLIRLSLAALFLAACARDLPGDKPPDRAFYYPLGLAAAPDGQHIYVLSSNFDLRFNTGWVSTVNLDELLLQSAVGEGDVVDTIVGRTRIPPLGGSIAVSESGAFAVVPHRGEPTLSLLEIGADGRSLSCGDASATGGLSSEEKRTDCDRAHLYQFSGEDFDPAVPDSELTNPYSAALFTYRPDGGAETALLAVGHLSENRVSVFSVTAGNVVGEQPTLEARRAIRIQSAAKYPPGIGTVVPHPDAGGSFVAATTRVVGGTREGTNSALYGIDIGRSLDERKDRVVGHSVSSQIGGAQMLGIAFSADGQFAYAANQAPDTVVIFDARIETVEEVEPDRTIRTGVRRPRFSVIGAVPVPGRPADVLYIPRAGANDLVIVASFDDDALFVLLPQGGGLVLAGRLDDVGAGPFSMLHVNRSGRDLLVVTNFYGHSITVYDVTPANAIDFVRLAEIRSPEIEPSERIR